MTDIADIVRVQSGDASAFDVLYQQHYPTVFRRCLKAFHNKEDAEDVSQDVFMKVFSQISHFRHESNFSTWLYCITSNQIRDKHRKTQRCPQGETLEDFHIERLDVPADQFARLQIQEAIETVNEGDRRVLHQMLSGAAPTEIAEMSGRKRRNVIAQIGKIRCKINNHIYN